MHTEIDSSHLFGNNFKTFIKTGGKTMNYEGLKGAINFIIGDSEKEKRVLNVVNEYVQSLQQKNTAEKTEELPLNAQYLVAHGYKFVDMMFSNDPLRYWRKDKLIVRKTETGFAIDLFNDKEQHIEIEVNTARKLHQIEELLGS